MADLDHPHIVKVLDPRNEDGEWFFFTMFFVDGPDLYRTCRVSKLPVEKAVDVISKVSDAAHYAHERGVIHRDITPSNVLLELSGNCWLADFDLVKAFDTTGGTSGALGKAWYSAPEVLKQAKDVDRVVDVYSLGMTLLYAVTGRDPDIELLRNPERAVDGIGLSEALQDVLLRAIRLKPADRTQTAAEFRDGLAAACAK